MALALMETAPPPTVAAVPKLSRTDAFLAKFRRITSSGQFFGEIDGLRFIAIVSVVLFHIHSYLNQANHFSYAHANESFRNFAGLLRHGDIGVELFFVISGFILALPFASCFLRGGKPVRLKSYYLRRVTRLEPPYFLALALCFVLLWHHHPSEGREYARSLSASLLYSHNFFWPRGTLPLTNPVAWSLEIEIQFYVLAPFIACVYQLGKTPRRALLAALILARVVILANYPLPHLSVLDFYDLFLIGFLLADLWVCNELNVGTHEWFYIPAAGAMFAAVWFLGVRWLSLEIGLFYYFCLKSRFLRSLLANRWIATVGGMCYSIYLIHWMLITTVGSRVVHQFTGSYAVDFIIHSLLLALLVLAAGAIYFKLIERPCMAKDWYKKLFRFSRPVPQPASAAL